MKRVLLFLLACLAPMASGCAWADPDRRPVYQAFEESLVPEDDTWFITTLPLTIPAGLLAIATDVLIVGPAMAADEAADEASRQWDDLDWKEDYVTQVTVTPLRAASTAGEFALQWAWRSVFRANDPADDEELEAQREAEYQAFLEKQLQEQEEARKLLENTLRDPRAELPPVDTLVFFEWGDEWTPELEQLLRDRLRDLDPGRRLWFYRAAMYNRFDEADVSGFAWTRDPDPVLRAALLAERMGRGDGYGPATMMKDDDDPVVRALVETILSRQRGR